MLRTKYFLPGSLSEKFLLLVVDKLVIGVIIAAAFWVYDSHKTTQAQEYEEHQQELQLGFKRAEYVKDLIPIVIDQHADLLYRLNSLGALIDTGSISKENAITFAQDLLGDDVLQAKSSTHIVGNNIVTESPDEKAIPKSRRNYLIGELMHVMPDGIDQVLTVYSQSDDDLGILMRGKITKANDNTIRVLTGEKLFWDELILNTINTESNEKLSSLNSNNPFETIASMESELHIDSATLDKWSKRPIVTLRIVAALVMRNYYVSDRTGYEKRNEGDSLLQPYIRCSQTVECINLSKRILDYLCDQRVSDPNLNQVVMDVIASDKKAGDQSRAAAAGIDSSLQEAHRDRLDSAIQYSDFIYKTKRDEH